MITTPVGDMRSHASALDKPEHWQLERGGKEYPKADFVRPSTESYVVGCWTLCGGEYAIVEAVCSQEMRSSAFVRRVRISSAIQHWLQNRCDECHRRLCNTLSPAEKEYIWCTDPKLGSILGFGSGTTSAIDDLKK